jgi:hypothetical protein
VKHLKFEMRYASQKPRNKPSNKPKPINQQSEAITAMK